MTRRLSQVLLFAAFIVAAAIVPTQANAQTLTKVTVTPTSASTPLGKTYQFQAYGWFSNGTRQLLTSKAQWTSSNPATATVESSAGSGGVLIGTGGKVNTLAQGVVTITATYTQPGGPTHSGTATFTVAAPTVSAVAIGLSSPSVAIGGSVSLTATATYTDGTSADVTAKATFSSSSTTIATVNNVTDTATGKAQGTVTLSATVGTARGSATLVVDGASFDTLTVVSAGGGKVTSNPSGIVCGTTCAKAYATTVNSVVLTATPDAGNKFAGWNPTECTVNPTNPNVCTVSLIGDKTVTANFQGKVNVLRHGGGGGTVTSNLGGITCGSDCSEYYNIGSSAQLTAVENFAGTGGSFDSWSGCDSVSGNVCTVKVTGTRQPQATFDMDLDVVVFGDPTAPGNATVVSNITGINCDSTESVVGGCSEEYHYNTAVNLLITPPPGSHVNATGCDIPLYTVPNTEQSICTVTMNQPKTVTVRFVYYLDVTLYNNGGGTVTDDGGDLANQPGNGINCNPDGLGGASDCHGEFLTGSTVVLTGTPNFDGTGGHFELWTGCDTTGGTENRECTIYLDSDKTVNASFEFEVNTDFAHGTGSVTYNANADTQGTYAGDWNDSLTDVVDMERVSYEDSISISASATNPSYFLSWTGCDSTGPFSAPALTGSTCNITSVTSPENLEVRFNIAPVADDLSFTFDEDSTGNAITFTFTDADGDTVTFNVPTLTTAEGGTVDEGTPADDADVTYDPAADFASAAPNGDDSFTYDINDGFSGGTDSGTVTITVTPINDPPVITAIADQTFDEDEDLSAYSVSVVVTPGGGADEAGQTFTYSVDDSAATGVADVNIDGSGVLTFTLTLDQNGGPFDIIVTVQDSGGTTNGGDDTSDDTFALTVGAVNDPPVVTAIADQTYNEDDAGSPFTITVTATPGGGADEAGQNLSYSVAQSGAGASAFTTGLDVSNNIVITLVADANNDVDGPGTVTLTVQDDGPGTAPDDNSTDEAFTVTVTGQPDPPVISVPGAQAVNEGSNLTFTVTANDPDAGDTLTYSSPDLPAGATLNASTGVFNWTPDGDDALASPYTVTFVVTDSTTNTDSNTVMITVNNAAFITATPITASIFPAQTQQLTVSYTDLSDAVTDVTADAATLYSDGGSAVLTVDGVGLVTGDDGGSAVINIEYDHDGDGGAVTAALMDTVTISVAELFAGTADNHGFDVGHFSGDLWFVVDDDGADESFVYRLDTPSLLPDGSFVTGSQAAASFQGLALINDDSYAVGMGSTGGSCGVTGSAKVIMAPYDNAGTAGTCTTTNIFAADGFEQFTKAMHLNLSGTDYIFAVGWGNAEPGFGAEFLTRYDTTGALLAKTTSDDHLDCLTTTPCTATVSNQGLGLTAIGSDVFVVGNSSTGINAAYIARYDGNFADGADGEIEHLVGDTGATLRAALPIGTDVLAVGAKNGNYFVARVTTAGSLAFTYQLATDEGGTETFNDVIEVGGRYFAVGSALVSGNFRLVIKEINITDGTLTNIATLDTATDEIAFGVTTDGTDLYIVGEHGAFGSRDAFVLRFVIP